MFKKNKWVKTWLPDDTNEEDDDKEWFWFDKEGKLFRANVDIASAESASNAVKYKFEEGLLFSDKEVGRIAKKKVNSKDYWFRADGVMLSKFYKINDAMYYFGGSDDGSMKTGSQSIKDNTGDTYKFYFYTKDQDKTKYTTPEEGNQLKKGAGVVGNQSNKLYYYGLLLTADDYKYQVAKVGGYEFIINSNGSIQHSYSATYKEDGDTLITVDEKLGTKYKDANGNEQVGTAEYEEKDTQFKYGFKTGVNSVVKDVDLTDFYKIHK